MNRRKLLWGVLALVIAGLTIWAVFSQSKALSVQSLLESLENASPFWMAMTFLSMAGFILFESLALLCILRSLGYGVHLPRALLYGAGDQFFSAITPSATGGQPASALFMGAHGIPGGAVTVALLLNLVFYTAATLTIGLGCFLLRPGVLTRFGTLSRVLIFIGMGMVCLLVLLFLMLLQRGAFLDRVGRRFIGFLSRLHLIRNREGWIGRLDNLVAEYRLCAESIPGKPGMLAGVFLLNLAQRISQISVTLMLYLAQGGSPETGADLWAVQALSQIGSTWVPIPGGMGAADYLMLDGFGAILHGDDVFRLQLLSRGISFYLCTLISGLIVLLGFAGLWLRKRRAAKRTAP